MTDAEQFYAWVIFLAALGIVLMCIGAALSGFFATRAERDDGLCEPGCPRCKRAIQVVRNDEPGAA